MTAVVLSFCGLVGACLALLRAVSDHYSMRRDVARFEQELQRTQKLLTQQGVLANEIAHELKNPITAILCSVDTLDLLAGDQLAPNHRKSLRAIKEFGENVLRLLSDFLDVSRAESGLLTARPERFSVKPVAENVLTLLQALAVKSRVELLYEEETDIDAVFMDPRHLKQVLFNLVHNGIKFSYPGTAVVVRVAHDSTGALRITVADTGVGMSSETAEHAFEPYYSADEQSGEMEGTGIGLGLPLCKSLVQLAGGTIAIDSSPGGGTTICLEVPCALAPDDEGKQQAATLISAPVPQQSTVRRPLSGRRVLILDEDDRIRRSVGELIEAWGGLVEGVAAASEAVEALNAEKFDAVMIDKRTRDTDRSVADVVSELQEHGTTVILSCGESDDVFATTGELEPELPTLSKPYNGSALLTALLQGLKGERFSH